MTLALTGVGTDGVAIGANNFALCHLCDNGGPRTVAADHIGHVSQLVASNVIQLQTAAIGHAAVSASKGSLVDSNGPPLDCAEAVTSLVLCHV